MSSETIVKASWGPRPESSEELAGRWLELITRLTELSAGALADWRWDSHGASPGAGVPDDIDVLAAAIETANPHDDADIIGSTAYAVGRRSDGGYAQLKVVAGGTNQYSPFTAALLLLPGAPEAPVPLADRLPEALAAVAGIWDADTGSTHDRELFAALRTAYGLRPSQPRCGWSVFLSANRAARVPADLAAPRLEAGPGGVVLNIGTTTDAVLAAHKTLTDAGALEPLPHPADRPKL
ncbi:hypothetical protein OG875_11195 [Streptomyces sp. NBC_01498]|uniref:hypothetical protein n=1 Tax=Streptomyces sp. NBC_01498 TaxID=2975870 RepID=UPI002E7C0BE2|nr:hypothetical protein [Streptomyces sp. NBC_01498]WTL25114.1 hypothetical protein OG875_11195 [Streptomyces sp. NBC_01498]